MKSKTPAIIKIVIFSVLAIILCGLLVCGIVFSSHMNFFGIPLVSFNDKNYTKYSSPVSIDGGEINSLNIDWTAGNVEITKSDTSQITFEESSNAIIDNDEKLIYKVDGDKLTIKYQKIRIWLFFGHTQSKTLKVNLPDKLYDELVVAATSAKTNISDIKAEKLNVDTVSGEVIVSNSSAKDFDLNTVSGDAIIDSCTYDKLVTDAISGKIDFSGTLNDLADMNTVSGDIRIKSTVCPKSIDSDSVSGSVTLVIPENSGFSADFDTVSGSFTSSIPTSTQNDKHIAGNGEAKFDFNSTSGSVTVNYK